MSYIYNPFSAVVDPTGEENPVVIDPVETEETNQIDTTIEGVEAWKHTNPVITQLNINDVANQLSNDPQRPEMSVTKEDLLNGGSPDYAFGNPLSDQRDADAKKNAKPDGNTVDTSTLTSNDPNHWAYDGNADGVPDAMQWKVI